MQAVEADSLLFGCFDPAWESSSVRCHVCPRDCTYYIYTVYHQFAGSKDSRKRGQLGRSVLDALMIQQRRPMMNLDAGLIVDPS